MITEVISVNETKVKWGFYGSYGLSSNILLPLCKMEKIIGNDLQTGLDNLKVILENRGPSFDIEKNRNSTKVAVFFIDIFFYYLFSKYARTFFFNSFIDI
jgi:hypothetical protein